MLQHSPSRLSVHTCSPEQAKPPFQADDFVCGLVMCWSQAIWQSFCRRLATVHNLTSIGPVILASIYTVGSKCSQHSLHSGISKQRFLTKLDIAWHAPRSAWDGYPVMEKKREDHFSKMDRAVWIWTRMRETAEEEREGGRISAAILSAWLLLLPPTRADHQPPSLPQSSNHPLKII